MRLNWLADGILTHLPVMNRRAFIASLAATSIVSPAFAAENADLIKSITKETVWRNRDGKSLTWFHPRACMMPDGKGGRKALMAVQEIGGSDYFGPVQWSESTDLGRNWKTPAPIESLGRIPEPSHPGLMAGVCDVVPQYHAKSGTVLAMGHVVFYRGPRFSKNDQLARYPVYSVRRADGTWGPRKVLKWNDPRGGFIYSNNCGQRIELPDGDILLAFTFGPESKNRMVAGVRCSFDGETLKIKEVGKPFELNHGRGLLEPSVALFKDRVHITIRAEDGHGYHSMSADGLNWEPKRKWIWDDGSAISMSTTQQHWLTHSDGLYLVYTRKDESNSGVIRWRSPLWTARMDTGTGRLIRATERVVLPLVGDGVKDPNKVALMGNFNVTNASRDESWVTVGEWMPRNGAKGDLLLARIRWKEPNRLVPR